MKKRLFALAAAMLLLAGCSASRVRLGAAREGGVYQQFCAAYASLSGRPAVEAKLTAGSAANLRLLSNGYIQPNLTWPPTPTMVRACLSTRTP